MGRKFIQETIDGLLNTSESIKLNWTNFQNGTINKEVFEEKYSEILRNLTSDLDSEIYNPNNGCKYRVTNSENDYFLINDY